MSLERLLVQTEAYVQEEIGAQRRLLALLGEQERATQQNDTDALLASTEKIESALADEPTRERRRSALVDAFARHWSVPRAVITISSIAERAGSSGHRLARLRGELADAVREVSQTGRRLAALAHLHRGVLGDLIHLLVGDDVSDETSGGDLIHVEA